MIFVTEKNENWYRKSWMTDTQYECWCFLARVFHGFHHVNLKGVKDWGNGIRYTCPTFHNLATFDADYLTRLVILAHTDCFRVDVSPCNMKNIYLDVHKRKGRTGSMFERHATIEQAVATHSRDQFSREEKAK